MTSLVTKESAHLLLDDYCLSTFASISVLVTWREASSVEESFDVIAACGPGFTAVEEGGNADSLTDKQTHVIFFSTRLNPVVF